MPMSTREALLNSAMRLFGENGYRATTIAQIEQAAGLSPGAGGLYSHFPSKLALLEAGLRRVMDEPAQAPADPPPVDPAPVDLDAAAPPLVDQLESIGRAGLARLRHDQDLNRVLIRDLRGMPELLELVAEREIRPAHAQLRAFLAHSWPTLCGSERGAGDTDASVTALAAVLIAAISHYWIFVDVFGEHPAQVTEDDFIRMLARLGATVINSDRATETT
jgi:AcrR family transcriptional regulator